MNILEQSEANTQVDRTRLQLNSNEMFMSLVAVRKELEESRAATTAARVAEEAGRQQLARMMASNWSRVRLSRHSVVKWRPAIALLEMLKPY